MAGRPRGERTPARTALEISAALQRLALREFAEPELGKVMGEARELASESLCSEVSTFSEGETEVGEKDGLAWDRGEGDAGEGKNGGGAGGSEETRFSGANFPRILLGRGGGSLRLAGERLLPGPGELRRRFCSDTRRTGLEAGARLLEVGAERVFRGFLSSNFGGVLCIFFLSRGRSLDSIDFRAFERSFSIRALDSPFVFTLSDLGA